MIGTRGSFRRGSRVRSSGFLAALSLASVAFLGSALAADFDEADFSARVEQMRARTKVPGLAVAVVQGGEIVLAEGYGVAGPDGRPVTGQTSFQIGSITKSIVALVVLQLAAEAKLDLDDPVVKYLPTFRTADDAASARITIDELVTQRSGLSTLAGNRRHASTDGASDGPAVEVAALAHEQLFAPPGRAFQYSNANYVVLSELIEVLDGRPFEESLARRIFAPLGMEHSFVGRPALAGQDVASGYRSWFSFARPTDIVGSRRMMGAGGVVASAEDMARYLIALQTRDPRVVPASTDRLFAAHPITGSVGYAYGWNVSEDADGRLAFHSGLTPGFNSLAALDLTAGRAVVVLTNLSGILRGNLAQAVTHEALGLEPVKPGPSLSAQLALWSGLAAVLGIGLWLFKTGRRLFVAPQPMRSWVRWLNVVAVLAIVLAIVLVLALFGRVVGTSIASARVFFPDLVLILFVSCGMLALLALGRLVLVLRRG